MKKKMYFIVLVCIMMVLTGCGNVGQESKGKVNEREKNTDTEVQVKESESPYTETDTGADAEMADSELEEELKKYRQEREDSIIESNGLVEGGSPDEDDYSFDMSGTYYGGQFDIREVTEAYAAARIYVTDTLGIKKNTKMATYMCVDPRILAIYEDEDKGVASGYDNSNIFVCEFCDEDGVWHYLILVRDGKGSAWNVIHNGNSYKE